jgi:hypothetical protein
VGATVDMKSLLISRERCRGRYLTGYRRLDF